MGIYLAKNNDNKIMHTEIIIIIINDNNIIQLLHIPGLLEQESWCISLCRDVGLRWWAFSLIDLFDSKKFQICSFLMYDSNGEVNEQVCT